MDRALELAFEQRRVDHAAHVVRGHQRLESSLLVQDRQLRRVAERQVRDRVLDRRAELRGLVVDELAEVGLAHQLLQRLRRQLGLELLGREHHRASAAHRRARCGGHARLHLVVGVDGGAEAARVDAGHLRGHLDQHGVQALAHLGVAVGQRDRAVLLDGERGATDVRHAVADAHVLDPARQPDRLALRARLVVARLDQRERLLQADRVQLLARAERRALLQRVAVADLPRVEPELDGQHVERALDGEPGLVGAEPAHRAARRVVGVHRLPLDVHVVDVVGAGRVAARALDHLRAHRRVRALVADHLGAHRGELAVRVAADRVVHGDRVALRVQADRLDAIDGQLDRAFGREREQRGLRLDRQILLAAERAAAADQRHAQPLGRHADRRGELPVIVVDALSLRVDVQAGRRAAVGVDRAGWHRQAALRLEERVLDHLRLPGAAHHVRRRLQRRLDVAARQLRGGEQVVGVPVFWMQQRRARRERRLRRGDRREHLVVDLDQLRRAARQLARIRRHRTQDVAGVAGLLTDGDEDRPVGIDQSLKTLARHVGRADHRAHAGERQRLGRVDSAHARARMRRHHHRAVQHARHRHVVDVLAIAERQRLRFVLGHARADLPRPVRLGKRAAAQHAGRQLDRVDDLDVAGAAAQVRAQALRDLLARRRRRLVDDVLGPHHDPGDAEPALHAAGERERLGEDLALALVDALERDHAAPHRLLGGKRARHLGLPVDQHGAAAALTGRRAAVLGRGHSAPFADQLEQRSPVVDVRRFLRAVEREPNRGHWAELYSIGSIRSASKD